METERGQEMIVCLFLCAIVILYTERYNAWKLYVHIKYTIQKIPLKIRIVYDKLIIWLLKEIEKGKKER